MHVGGAGLVAELGAQAPEEAAHLRRIGVADGVGQARFVGAGGRALRGQPDHFVFRHLALQRAAEGGRDAGLELHLRRDLAAQLGDGAHLLDHLLARLAHIGQRVRGAGRHRHRELVHAGLERGLAPLRLGTSAITVRPGSVTAWRTTSAASAICGSRLGRHERGDFDLAHAGGVERIDPAQLVRRGHGAP